MTRTDELPGPDEPFMVTTSYGIGLSISTKEIWVPGFSCAARGVALLRASCDHEFSAAEVVELTGDRLADVEAWIEELGESHHLELEED